MNDDQLFRVHPSMIESPVVQKMLTDGWLIPVKTLDTNTAERVSLNGNWFDGNWFEVGDIWLDDEKRDQFRVAFVDAALGGQDD